MMKGILLTEVGTYRVTFDSGIVNGKRVRKYKTYKTLKEAEKALTEFNYKKQRNLIVPSDKMLLSYYMNYWLENYVDIKCQETTAYGYRNIINKHFIPYFEKTELQKFKTDHLQQYYKHLLQEKDLSPNTVIKHHACIRKSLDFAVKQQFVYNNVAINAEIPKKIEFEGNAYTKEQLKKLLEATYEHQIEVAVYLGGFLGLRREEVVGLKWKNVDLNNRIIYINEVRTSAGKDVVVKTPKTSESKRKIYIPDELLDVLLRVKEKQNNYKKILKERYVDSGYVYTKNDGSLYKVNTITDQFRKFLKKKNFPHIRFHDLRHTTASILYEANVDIMAISQLLGHSNLATTSKIYINRFDKTHMKTMNAMSVAINV